jgi:hypothetical protein
MSVEEKPNGTQSQKTSYAVLRDPFGNWGNPEIAVGWRRRRNQHPLPFPQFAFHRTAEIVEDASAFASSLSNVSRAMAPGA